MKNWPVCPECCERLYNPAVTKGICSWCKSKSSDGWRFVQCEPLSSHRRTKEEMEFDDKPKGKGGRKKGKYDPRPKIKRLSKKRFAVNGIAYDLEYGVSLTTKSRGIPTITISQPRAKRHFKEISLLKGNIPYKIHHANDIARAIWAGHEKKDFSKCAEYKNVGHKTYLVEGVEYVLEDGVCIRDDGRGYVALMITWYFLGAARRKFFKLTAHNAGQQIERANELSRQMRAEQER
jgi:hypothetical protein